MGSQCSVRRRGKIEENDQKDSEVSTTVKSEEKSSLLQRRPSMQEQCGASPCISGTQDPALASTAEKEADWVDKNRAKLIQNVTSVMQIADQLVEQQIIHKEMYANIEAAATSMEKMRVLLRALTCPTVKSAFFRILKEIEPATYETQDIMEVMKKHKAYLGEKFGYEFEGTEKDHREVKSLDRIYTELHIIQGESKHVNTEHEIWEIEDKTRSETPDGMKINCNDLFKSTPNAGTSPGHYRGEVRAIRTVMTKGIAGIGKTVSVKKFILDWADGKANQNLDFIFVLPFRELNLLISNELSLETLVKEFHPELKGIAAAKIFANHKVLFIFDGLDESQLELNFKTTKRVTDATEKSSVDTLVTNIIREHLLPSALVWITSRPGAVHRIPRQYVYQWTEVRGFNELQKIEYFRKRVQDKVVAERIINHILMSRSLFIMCHIPIFCWIAAKVLEYLLLNMDGTQDQNVKIPTTLTEMYTYFLLIQMELASEKYDSHNQSHMGEIFKSNEEFIFKLGRMAFEQLKESKIIFTGHDLTHYGIDINKAGIYCGLCTEILKEENVFNTKKLYCFVHLTVQEYFAALFVYHSFASKKIDSPSLKDFLLKGSEEELKSTLDADPVDLPLDEFIEISLANSTQRKTGELDIFLRFLIGMSLQSTQELLQGLIQQTEEHSAVVEKIRTSLLELDLLDCSPERCLNFIHCLIELKDSSPHDTVQQYLRPNYGPETELSPFQCSALAHSILMSNVPLDEFDLKKCKPPVKGIFRLMPAVRNCRKARISGVHLDSWLCEGIASALRMPNSVLTELHLINNRFYDKSTRILIDGLLKSQCKLEALSLAGRGISQAMCGKLASAVKDIISNIRELELSGDILKDSLCSMLSEGLRQPKLEKLKLNRNPGTAKICEELVTALTSSQCYLRKLDLSYTQFSNSEMNILFPGLMSKNCKLEVLRLSFCKVTGDGCASLASALSSDHCSLKELDLSFNHLTDQGVRLLTEIQKDSHNGLEKLNTDQNEDFWFDLKLLRKYATDLTLDSNTVGATVILSKEKKMATYVSEKQPYPNHTERFDNCQVLCEEGLTGRHYWEVECVSADVGVAYKSMKVNGDCSSEFTLGQNKNSWCWSIQGHFSHDNSCVEFVGPPTYRFMSTSTIGVYLDWPAGILSFVEVFHDTVTHLYTICTTFTEPLHAGFHLHDGSLYLCEIQ
ncbi:protein NLRC3-like isoform X2 [Anabas testudineus]|uniref:protein NLRC3-like isoform X2 n=1 Tax=Anabas testudineus TaxID=64144 RepID=UPI000E462A99|nr:protein NLRC3-like isoform X2 [Anabas testudineus]